MAPQETLPTWFSTAIDSLARGDVDGWLDTFAVDAVHEFPWAPEGRVRRLEGHDEMRRHMGRLAGRLDVGHFDDVCTYEAGDETIIQATGHHKLAGGAARKIHYIWFITRRDNLTTRLQDYMKFA